MSADAATTSAIILAAGKGVRMGSDLPKVLHEVGGRPMVLAVVDALRAVGCGRIVAVVGYKQELVREALRGQNVEFVVQDKQLGTGHAVECARGVFTSKPAGKEDVFVLCGDGPLIRASTLRSLLAKHRSAKAAASLATATIDDPAGYGRIVRGEGGGFAGIVEHKDATEEQRRVREVNPSYYCFDRDALFGALARLEPSRASGEYYLTGVFDLLRRDGARVEVLPGVPPQDVLSINTPQELALVDRIYRSRAVGETA